MRTTSWWRALMFLAWLLIAAVAMSPTERAHEPETYTLAEACKLLGISRDLGYKLARKGHDPSRSDTFPVPIFRTRSIWRIPKQPLHDFLGRHGR